MTLFEGLIFACAVSVSATVIFRLLINPDYNPTARDLPRRPLKFQKNKKPRIIEMTEEKEAEIEEKKRLWDDN